MRILSTKDVSSIILNLSKGQILKLHDDLFRSMESLSAQNTSVTEPTAKILQPLRTLMKTSQSTTTLTMPASDTVNTSVKTVTVPADGPIQGSITVYNTAGELLGLINAAEITAFRTALASMLPLSRSKWGIQSKSPGQSSDGHNLVVFGGGRQAEWHIRLALEFATIKSVVAVNRSQKRAKDINDTLFKDLKEKYPHLSFRVLAQVNNHDYDSQLRQLLSESDIICCTTPSTMPLFPARYLQAKGGAKSRFITLIGSYKPHMQEVDKETIFSGYESKVIVDSVEACLEEAGEIIMANLGKESLVEIGTLYSESSEAATHLLAPDSANVIFKCVGMSLMDLVVSRALLDISREVGVGSVVNNF